jgi:hypothetical protein
MNPWLILWFFYIALLRIKMLGSEGYIEFCFGLPGALFKMCEVPASIWALMPQMPSG